MGVLKSLGFLNRRSGPTVYWQATTVATIGLVIGIPLRRGRRPAHLESFAQNIGACRSRSSSRRDRLIAIGALLISNLLSDRSRIRSGSGKDVECSRPGNRPNGAWGWTARSFLPIGTEVGVARHTSELLKQRRAHREVRWFRRLTAGDRGQCLSVSRMAPAWTIPWL